MRWTIQPEVDTIGREFHVLVSLLMRLRGRLAIVSELRNAASITTSSEQVPSGTRPEKSMALKTLIYQRRHCRIHSERKRLSKDIFNLARQELS